MKKIILYLIVIAAIASSCKKYEEGPLVSFRSAKNRLYGNYTLTYLTVDGKDCLSQYYDSLSKSFYFYEDNSSRVDYCDMIGIRKDDGLSSLSWTWELLDHNKILKIISAGGNPPGWSYGPFKTNILPEWKILRLTKKEKKLKTLYLDQEYVITLESL